MTTSPTALQAALLQRVRDHPEDLVDVMRSLVDTHAQAKRLHATDPTAAKTLFADLATKADRLLQLPWDVVPSAIRFDAWTTHLERIRRNCTDDAGPGPGPPASTSEPVAPVALPPPPTRYDTVAPDSLLAPWIHDWVDPTLQTPAVRQLVRHVVLPVLFPDAYAAVGGTRAASHHPHTILVDGPADTGKSYALGAVRRYCQRRKAVVRWVEWTAYDCPTAVCKRLNDPDDAPVLDDVWTVYVTDRVSTADLQAWGAAPWLRAWDRWLDRQSRALWVVLATTDTTLPSAVTVRFPTRVTFDLPDGRTVYHLLRKLLVRQYGHVTQADGRREPPTFARLPITEQFEALSQLADKLVRDRVSFAGLEALFQRAVCHCTRLALAENTVFSPVPTATAPDASPPSAAPQWWYPKNSVSLDAFHADKGYVRRLVTPLDHHELAWCPATQKGSDGDDAKCSVAPTVYRNAQLLDALPSTECDRFVHVYVDPASVDDAAAPTYQVIANFPVTTRVFPYHLHDGFDRCYEWTVALWLATVPMRDAVHEQYQALLSTADLCRTDPVVCDELFDAPTPLQGFGDVTEPRQVLYVEERVPSARTKASDGDRDGDPPLPRVHLSCGNKRSQDLEGFAHGVPGDARASTVQKLLQVLTQTMAVEVVQVQTHAGYAYYVDFAAPLATPLVAVAATEATSVSLMPRVTLLATTGGPHLDDTYRLTSESDVDALTEAYPRAYKDLYREEEETWKLLKPRAPEHLSALNRKYSHETKFYLKLCGDLLQAKRRFYATLDATTRTTLDHAITDLQNYLDFHQMLIEEQSEQGEWNEVWSMSPTHPAYTRYHPPAHNDVNAVVSVDLATEWMQKDMQYHVSPRWLLPFYALCTRFNGKTLASPSNAAQSARTPMQTLFRTWRWYRCEPVAEKTHWLYAKAAVDKAVWAEARSTERLLDQAFPSRGNGGRIGDANRGGYPTDTSADIVGETGQTERQRTPSRESTDDVLSCLQDARWMQGYATRTTSSLFHAVMRHASYLGRHDTEAGHIEWYEMRQGDVRDPLDATVNELARHQDTWAMLSKHCAYGHAVCHPWMFALNLCALCRGNPGVAVPPRGGAVSYHELYAHLLAFPTLHYWTLDGGTNVLTDIESQVALDDTVKQYAFVHRHVHRRQLALRGEMPDQYTRQCVVPSAHVSLVPKKNGTTGKTLSADGLRRVRVYGMGVHHLEDCWEG